MLETIIVAKTNYGFKYLYISIKNKEVISINWEDSPTLYKPANMVVSQDTIYSFSLTDMTYQDVLDCFHKSILIDDKKIYLQHLKFDDMNGRIYAGAYTLYTLESPIIVNYASGKNETFNELYDALYWITNIHYPSKQIELLETTLLY